MTDQLIFFEGTGGAKSPYRDFIKTNKDTKYTIHKTQKRRREREEGELKRQRKRKNNRGKETTTDSASIVRRLQKLTAWLCAEGAIALYRKNF
jgi:hypothetical protein